MEKVLKPGGGKQKGASFEREVCVKLSRWVTAGKRDDCFWRSAMSGGRATVRHKAGKKIQSQAGDISAITREGQQFTSHFFVECKHVKSLDLEALIFAAKGTLWGFWETACFEADKHNKQPFLIAKQNMRPVIAVIPLAQVAIFGLGEVHARARFLDCEGCDAGIYLLDTLLARPYRAHYF